MTTVTIAATDLAELLLDVAVGALSDETPTRTVARAWLLLVTSDQATAAVTWADDCIDADYAERLDEAMQDEMRRLTALPTTTRKT